MATIVHQAWINNAINYLSLMTDGFRGYFVRAPEGVVLHGRIVDKVLDDGTVDDD